jgi:hypothetical protein
MFIQLFYLISFFKKRKFSKYKIYLKLKYVLEIKVEISE